MNDYEMNTYKTHIQIKTLQHNQHPRIVPCPFLILVTCFPLTNEEAIFSGFDKDAIKCIKLSET